MIKTNQQPKETITMAIKKANLFIIDPQNDFCHPSKGSLFVAGADKDMSRLATMIKANTKMIRKIIVTLDSHNDFHIAHPSFTVDSNGVNPSPSPSSPTRMSSTASSVAHVLNGMPSLPSTPRNSKPVEITHFVSGHLTA